MLVHCQGPSIIYVNPFLNNSGVQASMQSAVDFVTMRGGSVDIEELPGWIAFFSKYVPAAQAVRSLCIFFPLFPHMTNTLRMHRL